VTEEQYQLPVTAIIETMKWLPDPTRLTSQLSALSGFSKDRYLIEVVVGQGKVLICSIHTATGFTLQGERALEVLQHCGALNWHVSPFLPSPVSPPEEQPTAPMSLREKPPTKRIGVVMEFWGHEETRVFALVDGKRPVEEIARLLHYTPQHVRDILLELKQQHVIE
jgi:hypothetical protein